MDRPLLLFDKRPKFGYSHVPQIRRIPHEAAFLFVRRSVLRLSAEKRFKIDIGATLYRKVLDGVLNKGDEQGSSNCQRLSRTNKKQTTPAEGLYQKAGLRCGD